MHENNTGYQSEFCMEGIELPGKGGIWAGVENIPE